MKNRVLLPIYISIILLVSFLLTAVVLSFTFVKKNTDNLIKIQRDELTSIIRIPNAVPPSNPSFYSISYRWDMETPEGEISGVNVLQTTAFLENEGSIIVILEKNPDGDESIFDKVLSSVVADEEVLKAAYSEEKITNLINGKTGFKSATIERNSSNEKITKIIWEFEKDNFGANAKSYFDKINSLPKPVIKTLYLVQSVILTSLSGQ